MRNKTLHLSDLRSRISANDVGHDIYGLIEELYPICRSITGNGFHETLLRLSKQIPLQIHAIQSGAQVFDWTVPREWNIRDAYVKNMRGERVIDFRKHNLHVLNFSAPVQGKMSLEELKPHLFTLPDRPDWIPYRTSYYKENWGFCLSYRQLEKMSDAEYEVCIDASLENGCLRYGECYLKGQTPDEVLISCHACHPSLCNDNLSGISVAVRLAAELSQASLRYSYRFLFIPGTIGSIVWLGANEANVSRIKHGLVLTCVGDRGNSTYKRSRRGDAEIDRAAAHVLKHSGQPYQILDFSPYGYDERQYCSPGFNLPVGCIMRTPHGCFPEYHTSADDLTFVNMGSLADSFLKCLSIIGVLENNVKYLNTNAKCEPQLGKRKLYGEIGGRDVQATEMAMLWALSFSDGEHTLLDIADKSGIEFSVISTAAEVLSRHGLLRTIDA